MYFVYLAECEDGSIYTGVTNDPARRLKQHKSKQGGRYTRSHAIKKILHTENFLTKSEALRREAEIKSWSRKKKIDLIERSR